MNVNVFPTLAMLLPSVAFILGSGHPSSRSAASSNRCAELDTGTRETKDCAQIVQTLGKDSQMTTDYSPIMKELHHNVQNDARALKIKRLSHLHRTRKTKKTRAHMASSSVKNSRGQALRNTFVHRPSVSSPDLKGNDSEESYYRFLESLIGTQYDLSDSSIYMSDSPPRQEKYKLIVFPDNIQDHSACGNKAKWILRFKNFTMSLPVSQSDIKHSRFRILRIRLSVALRVPKASDFRPQKISLRVHLRLQKKKKLLLARVTRDMLQTVQWVHLELPLNAAQVILSSLKPPDYTGALKVTCKRPGGRKCDFVGPVDRVSHAARKIRKDRMHSKRDFQYKPYLEITYFTDK